MFGFFKKDQWFWGVISYYTPLYVHVTVASFMINMFGIAMPLFVMNVYDRIVPNNAYESLWVLTIGILLVSALDLILRNARAYFVDTAGRNADVLLLGRFMDTLMDARLDASPAVSVGGLLSKVREFEYMREFLGSATLVALLDLPFIFIFIFLIYILGGWLVVVPLCAVPIMFFIGWLAQWPFERSARLQIQHSMKKNALLGEMAAGFETIRVTRLAQALTNRWDALVDQSSASTVQARFLGVSLAHANMFLNVVFSVCLVVTGVYLIGTGSLSMGGLIACMILQGRCLAPLSGIVNILGNLQKALVGLDAMRKLMDLPSENPKKYYSEHLDSQNKAIRDLGLENSTDITITRYASFLNSDIIKQPIKRALPVDITLDNLSFRYPGQDMLTLSLSNLNLKIKQGEHIGIIGATGSGKSTLARLISGLYLPTEGRVLYGTVDLCSTPMNSIRKNMGFLPQQVVLFSGTVRSNICDAWPDDIPQSEETLLKLANLCGVMDFASLHPLGLDMPVGEHGVGLSGGQAQTVALARALVGNPDTIILDEPTSNLDATSEFALCQRLATYFKGRTLIILTHRPSMLKLVDRVIVMEKGKIIKDGALNEVVSFS